MRDARLAVPALVLAIGIALTSGVRSQSSMGLPQPLRTIPPELAGLRGRDQPISEEEQRVAGMTDYLYRIFALDTASVFTVYVGYYPSQTTGKTIHSPRNCLPGAGWETLANAPEQLTIGPTSVRVNRVLIANGNAQAVVYYWYQGRGRVASNEYRVKWDLLRDAALYGRSEEALVRVLVPVNATASGTGSTWGGAQLHADSLARSVVTELIPRVDSVLPTWTHGAGAARLTRGGSAPSVGAPPIASGATIR